jgi:hypothetical protein
MPDAGKLWLVVEKRDLTYPDDRKACSLPTKKLDKSGILSNFN